MPARSPTPTTAITPTSWPGWSNAARYVVAVRRDFAVVGRRRAGEPTLRAEVLLDGLPGSAWRTIRRREGSRGWLRGRFAAVRCWRVTSEGRRHLGWLIGERAATGQDKRRKYYWSNFGPRMPLAQRVEYAHRRHRVERFHEEAKGLLGWDQYQGRLWTGFHRHAVAVMLASSSLVWQEWQQRQARRRRGRPRRAFPPSAGSPPAASARGPSPGGRLAPTRGAARARGQEFHRPVPSDAELTKQYYEAPEAGRLPREMAAFLDWFNVPAPVDPVLKAAQAHLWFLTIHPFDDGNGRIARALADMALARSEQSPKRFYSMSAQIWLERNEYYDVLERTQKGTLDVAPWMRWFLDCLDRAFDGAEATLADVLRKARFWEAQAGQPFDDRQRKVLNRLLDGFEGKLTSSKWAKLAKSSQDTAGRDINDLVKRGILLKDAAGGRSRSYSLADPAG